MKKKKLRKVKFQVDYNQLIILLRILEEQKNPDTLP